MTSHSPPALPGDGCVSSIYYQLCYFVYQGGAYLVPYISDAYGMTPDQTAVIGMIRAYFLAFIISPFAGLVADKIGSSLKVMASFFTLGALITASFIFIPHDSHFLILLITLVYC